MNKSQSIGGLVISVHSVSEGDFSKLCSILAFENSIDGFTVSDLCVAVRGNHVTIQACICLQNSAVALRNRSRATIRRIPQRLIDKLNSLP